jgi:hypothetical protein
MTKSNIGKVFIGMVLLVGSARAGQWQFARESTLVPPGPNETALGIQTLRVHAPVGAPNATVVTVDILNHDGRVMGRMVDTKSTLKAERGNAPEETIVLKFQDRVVTLHYRDRALWVSDGATSVSASFDRTNVGVVERLKAFAEDLRMIAGLQTSARPVIDSQDTARLTSQAAVLGSGFVERVARVVPARWTSWLGGRPSAAAAVDGASCMNDPGQAPWAGGFGASKSSACAYAQQSAHNSCAAESGYCIGCCAWVGSGCDCVCMLGDLACMCESCGGLCGPNELAPTPAPASR